MSKQPEIERPRLTLSERLFDTYATDLSAALSQQSDYVECPLCMTRFTRDDLRTRAVTDEHIIARRLGSRLRHQTWGKLRTLTCRRCNNRDGTKLDAHLIKWVRSEDILAGLTDEPLDIRFIVGDTDIGADLYLSASGKPSIKVIGDRKRSNPKMQEASGRAFEEGEKKFKVAVNLGYSTLNLNVALLRIAYLLMFRYFGYHYIRQENVRRVREQISHPDKDIIASLAVHKLNDAPSDLFSIDIIQTPPALQCFFIALDLSTALDRYIGIVMPGLDSDGEQIYEKWREHAKRRQSTNFSSARFPIDPRSPFNPELAGTIHKLWRSATGITDSKTKVRKRTGKKEAEKSEGVRRR